MASINKVMVMGRLGQDPDLRHTANQQSVCTLNVATTEFRTGQDGQRQELTEWHRIVVWGKQAENCKKYLAKGRMVFVEGRLQTRSWDDQSGQKRYSTEIVANNVQFLPQGASSGASNNQGYGQGGSFGGGTYGGSYGGSQDEGGGSPFGTKSAFEPTSFGSSFDSGAGFPSADTQAFNPSAGSSAFDDVPF